MRDRFSPRLVVGTALLLIAAFAALGFYLSDRASDSVYDSVSNELAGQARLFSSSALEFLASGEPRPPGTLDDLVDAAAADTGARVSVIADDGTVIADSLADADSIGSQITEPEFQEALTDGVGESTRLSMVAGERYFFVATRFETADGVTGVIRIGRPESSIDDRVPDIAGPVLLTAVLTSLVAAGMIIVAGNQLTGQIRKLTDAARAIADGHVSIRVEPVSSGPGAELAETFNLMAASIADIIEGAREERRRLMAALDSSVNAIVALDAGGAVAYANLTAGSLLHRSVDSLRGEHFAFLMPNDEVIEAFRSSREGGQLETRVIQRAGNEWLQVSVAPIVGGGDWSALVVIHDISDVKRVEQVRREFIANVSHELRTPLAGVKSVLETLEGGAIADEATAREFLQRADAEVDRLVRMVEELLELSRIESGEVPLAREPVDMDKLLQDAISRLKHRAERHNISISLEGGANGQPSVTGDPDRLERVALNLVSNAIKFTPEGGHVTVSSAVSDGMVTVRVTDTGVGIDPDDVPRVFERFYKVDRSRRESGTGLGLAVVKHTIEAHDGAVGVESELGKGSTFWFQIPLATDLPEN